MCCAGHSLAWLTWSSRPQPLCFHRPWQLFLCSSCAAEGTHRRCSQLSSTATTWECDSCAGLGTGKRQSATCHRAGARQDLAASARGSFQRVSLPQEGWQPVLTQGYRFILLTFPPPLTASSTVAQLAGPSAASQEDPGPSHSSQQPQDSRTGPTSQAASGPSHTSELPQLSRQNSELGQTEHGTICSRSPDHQDTSELHQAHCDSRCTAAPSAESSAHPSTRRGRSGSSGAATAAARRRRPRQQGTSRTRSRSPLQGRAPRSQSQTRRPQGSRRTAAPAAQNSTHSTSRAATQRISRASLRSHTAEQPRQPGEAPMQSRSSVAHRAPHVHSRP
ncbi:hypothetical protein CIB84_016940 [Bambusicola thoracicus]|uniref:PHF7/G2E3-like PHD zinc finger domain-containing protein n=1 Tax=Bambusicola thoracicus TaxID=9083 RepID=A0A2P4S5A1_BAMTH|nr:hypothetical protein CIB84_016940 [Bambusicola thoracicus]